MNFWSNLIAYQATWFIAVINAGRGRAWPGILAAVAFAFWQLAVSRDRVLELRLIGLALLLGTLIDGGLALGGQVQYAASSPALPAGGAPFWILALWLAFSLTLTQSLSWLHKRPLVGLLFGTVGAPLAYLGAQHGWNAVNFTSPAWHGLFWLASGWGVAIWSLLNVIARRSRAVCETGAWQDGAP